MHFHLKAKFQIENIVFANIQSYKVHLSVMDSQLYLIHLKICITHLKIVITDLKLSTVRTYPQRI